MYTVDCRAIGIFASYSHGKVSSSQLSRVVRLQFRLVTSFNKPKSKEITSGQCLSMTITSLSSLETDM